MSSVPNPLQYYLDKITDQHNQKPKFMATVAASVQPFVDLQQTLFQMIGLFTPNSGGDQLDKVGQLVGGNRNLAAPVAGVTVLSDPQFQILIKLVIAQNHWDGTVPGAYTLWSSVFSSSGIGILIGDNQDMTMVVVFTGTIANVVTRALLAGGYFNLRPAAVRITSFSQPSVPSAPVFGWGAQNDTIAGWGTGCWIEPLV